MANIQDRGNGSYFFTVSTGLGPDGKYGRKTKTYRPKGKFTPKQLEKDIQAAYIEFERQVQSGNYVKAAKVTLDEFYQIWLEKFAILNYEETTLSGHTNRYDFHIKPVLGHLKIDKISSVRLDDFLSELIRKDDPDKPLAVSTKIDVHKTLVSIFKLAKKRKLIKEDPMEDVDRPKDSKAIKKKLEVYSEEEISRLLAAVEHELPHWRIFIILALTAGLRRGEVLGLEWSKVDFEKNYIDIDQSIVRGRNGAVIKSTKTESSSRLVGLSQSVMDDLKKYRLHWRKERFRMKDKWVEDEREWLICKENGTHMFPTTPTYWWGKFTKRSGVRHIRLHDLRHTSASLLIAQNIHAKIISERLGHSKIGTTMDLYGHAMRSADHSAAESIDHIFKRNQVN